MNEIDFWDLQKFDGKFNRADGKSTVSHELDQKISTFLSRAFLAVDLMISCVSSPQSINS